MSTTQTQLESLEEANQSLTNEMQQVKEKHAQLIRDQASKFEEQMNDVMQSKDKEIVFFQSEMNKYLAENEKLNSLVSRLQIEKQSLEEEINMFSETKQAMNKYDWQMNEILNMLNDEKAVRGHLRSLASKLIEEVDTLKMQTAASNSSMLGLTSGNVNSNLAQFSLTSSLNGPNSHVNIHSIAIIRHLLQRYHQQFILKQLIRIRDYRMMIV